MNEKPKLSIPAATATANDDLPPGSYVRGISPKSQYQELNVSLMAQVEFTRKNLVDDLDHQQRRPNSRQDDDDRGDGGNRRSDDSIVTAATPATAIKRKPGGKKAKEDEEECVKCFLKIRPFKEEELKKNEDKACFEIKSSTGISAHAPPESTTYKNDLQLYGDGKRDYKFTFSRVFAQDTTQKCFFDTTTRPFIQNLLLGQDALLFSYGVTNGGKTFTFQGADNEPGLIPRSLDQLIQSLKERLITEPNLMPKMFGDSQPIDERKRQEMEARKRALWKFLDTGELESILSASSTTTTTFNTASSTCQTFMSAESSLGSSQSSLNSMDDLTGGSMSQNSTTSIIANTDVAVGNYRCSIWISFCEIYNENVYDLLVPFTGAKPKDRPTLKVSEDKCGNVYVKGANEYYVTSVDEAIKLMMVGRKNLQIAATKLNYNSSRSHCIYSLRLLKEFDQSDGTMICQTNRLAFCDLAGSERSSKIDGCSLRKKETGSINASLLTLGRCIRLLRWNQTHKNQPQIIPYRDSKLTRLFQHYLSRAQTCMVVNINQCASCFDETLNVLKFSAVAKEVKTIQQALHVIASPGRAPPSKLSLLWNQHCSEASRKQTIGWASNAGDTSPSTIKKKRRSVAEIAAVEVEKTLDAQLPSEDEEDDDLDKTLDDNHQALNDLITIIEGLKRQLITSKQENLLQEQRIRDELSEEYVRMYQDMADSKTKDKEDAVAAAEDVAENRLNLYIRSVNNRRRTMGTVKMNEEADTDDEDAYVSAEIVKAKDKEIDDLRREIADLKRQLSATLSGESSKPGAGGDRTHPLVNEVASLKKAFKDLETEKRDVETTLEEAAETFQQQKAEIEKLKKILSKTGVKVEDDVSIMDDSDVASAAPSTIKKAEESPAEKSSSMDVDVTMAKTTTPTPAAAASASSTSLESDEGFKLIELESKIFELEDLLEKEKQKTNAAERERTTIADEKRELMEKLTQFDDERSRAIDSKSEEIRRLADELATIRARFESLDVEKNRLVEELSTKSVESDRLQSTIDQLHGDVSRLTADMAALTERFDSSQKQKETLETTIRQNLEKMLAMSREQKKYEERIDEEKREKTRLSGEFEERIQKMNANVDEARTDRERFVREFERNMAENEEKSKQIQDRLEQLETENAKLTGDLERAKEELVAKKDEAERKDEELGKVRSELEQLLGTMNQIEGKIDSERRTSLEEGNRLRRELEEVKTTLVNIKKEKLELRESMKTTEDECKRLSRTVEDKEADLIKERERAQHLLEDMQKNEQAIQSYKAAMHQVDGVTEKYEQALAKKKQEMEECQKELQNAREKFEISEKNFSLEQKKSMRCQSDLNLKTELETKLRADLTVLETRFNEKCQESERLRQQVADITLQLNQASHAHSAVKHDAECAKAANTVLMGASDAMKKDLHAKEQRLIDLDNRLATAKKQAVELQQLMTAKTKETEDLTRASEESRKNYEQLEVRFRNAEDERSSLVESVRQLKAENEKLNAARLPPAAVGGGVGGGGGRRRGGRAGGTMEHDNAEEVEVTPMAMLKPQKGSASKSKKAGGSIVDSTTKDPAPETAEPQTAGKAARGRGKGSTSRTRKNSDNDDAASDATSTSMASGGKSPVTSPKPAPKAAAQRKTKPKESKNSSALNVLDFPFPDDQRVSNTGRPQRRAAQMALDRNLALSVAMKGSATATASSNTVSEDTTSAAHTATMAMESASSSTTAGAELPLKKRRLLKDPTVPCFSPAAEEKPKSDLIGETINSTFKTSPKKKKN